MWGFCGSACLNTRWRESRGGEVKTMQPILMSAEALSRWIDIKMRRCGMKLVRTQLTAGCCSIVSTENFVFLTIKRIINSFLGKLMEWVLWLMHVVVVYRSWFCKKKKLIVKPEMRQFLFGNLTSCLTKIRCDQMFSVSPVDSVLSASEWEERAAVTERAPQSSRGGVERGGWERGEGHQPGGGRRGGV